jgi:hypothetical protein
MDGTRARRLASLGGAGFFVLSMAGHLAYPADPGFAARPAEIAALYARHHEAILAADALYLLGGALLLVFAGALRGALAGEDALATTILGALVAGSALLLAGAAIDAAAALRVQQQGAIGPQVATALRDLSMILFGLGAPMAFAVAVLGSAAAAWRTRALPLWLGAASLVLGIALAVPPIDHVAAIVFTFWVFTASLVLALRASGTSTAPAGTDVRGSVLHQK